MMNANSKVVAILRTPVLDLARGRIHAQTWKAVIAEGNLPEPAALLVREAIRRTRLRRGEKAEVAHELVSHFAEALDAGVTAESAVEAFGDPKLAARLIRRAKKRQRGLLWQVQRGLGWAIVLAIGLYVLLVVRLFLVSPGPTTDLVAEMRNELPGDPDDAFAWPLYLEALAAFDDVDWSWGARGDVRDALSEAKSGAPDTEWARRIARQPEVVEQLREASKLPRILPMPSTELTEFEVEALMPEEMPDPVYPLFPPPVTFVASPAIDYANAIGDILAVDMRLAAAEGDLDRVIEDMQALIRFAEQFSKEPSDGHHWTAGRARQRALRGFADVLAAQRTALTDQQLIEAAHLLATINPADDSYTGMMLGFRDFIQKSYSAGTIGEGHLTDEGVRNLIELLRGNPTTGAFYAAREGQPLAYTALPVLAARFPSREEMEAYGDRLERLAREALDRPVYAALDTAYDAVTKDWWEDGVPQSPTGLLYSRLLPSSVDVVRFSRARAETQRDGLLIAIAAELFRRDHNRWPDDIAELTPRYLPEVPIDAMTGAPLRMKITDDLPLVYSIGLDGDDDGGRPIIRKNGQTSVDFAQWRLNDGDTRLWPPEHNSQ